MNSLPFPLSLATTLLVAVLTLALICAAAILRAHLTRLPRAGVTPATPHAGFATPDDLREHLSEAAVRKAGAQVRPGLVHQRRPVHDR